MHQSFEDFVLASGLFQSIAIEDLSEEERKKLDSFCSCHTPEELLEASNNFAAYINLVIKTAARLAKEEGEKVKLTTAQSDKFHTKIEPLKQKIEPPVQNTLF